MQIAPVLLKNLNPPRGYAETVERSAVDKLTADMELARARLGTATVPEQNPLASLPPGTTLEIRGDDSVV